MYAIAAQGYQSQSYYIASYELQTSENGNTFSYITETSGDKKVSLQNAVVVISTVAKLSKSKDVS